MQLETEEVIMYTLYTTPSRGAELFVSGSPVGCPFFPLLLAFLGVAETFSSIRARSPGLYDHSGSTNDMMGAADSTILKVCGGSNGEEW